MLRIRSVLLLVRCDYFSDNHLESIFIVYDLLSSNIISIMSCSMLSSVMANYR